VLHENRVIGTTDRNGHLLIPDLNAYQHNQVAIDSMKPARPTAHRHDLHGSRAEVADGRAGEFRLTRYSAASVILRGADGKLLPPGTRVHHVRKRGDTISLRRP